MLTREKETDRYRKRNYLARELIKMDLTTSLLLIGIIKKVAELIIIEWWDQWHSFFQKEIWLQCCNKITKWKKELQIDPKRKKNKKESSAIKKKNREGKSIDKGEDLLDRVKKGSKRQKMVDKSNN
ncbi:28174_t:CDS:2 [Gigaspora margarita]|uniref:28174_t:CDS:1 n=1 Tax=Gigaspora margarita TaxID=4874 RepID=A0ABN7ULF5_GIGMA|nr:28174_t:CDS:2 [Gigaspora margarita]